MATKKLKLGLVTLGILIGAFVNAQTEGVSIKSNPSAPHSSAMLDVESSTKGLLIPRVYIQATNNAQPVSSPTQGLLIYNPGIGYSVSISSPPTTTVGEGFYYWDGFSSWIRLSTSPELWKKIGNTNNINYTAGKVLVGAPAYTNQIHDFEVRASSSTSSFTARFETPFGGLLRFGATDSDRGGPNAGPGNWLTMKSASLTMGGDVWNQPNMFSMVGGATTFTGGGSIDDRSLSFNCWPKKSGTIGFITIESHLNNLQIKSDAKWVMLSTPIGSLAVQNGGLISFSDSTLKRNIEDETEAISRIKSCRPVTYALKADKSNLPQHGFIAQELMQTFPELVTSIDVEDGTEDIPGVGQGKKFKTKLGLNYSGLVSVLTKAIQEQQTMIEELRYRVEMLENR